MGMVILTTQAQVYAPGADLWLIPPFEDSRWSRRLDWYLNFQISRNFRWVRPELVPPLQGILDQIGWKDPSTRDAILEGSTLMVGAQDHLPSRWVVMVGRGSEEKINLRSWSSRLLKVYQDLGSPSSRVFLPKGLAPEDFYQVLGPDFFERGDFSLVAE